MNLTKEDLLKVFTQEQLRKSTYTTPRGKKHIRLINNKPNYALVPALYPNKLSYRKALIKYDNVIDKRSEFDGAKYTGNQKMDLDLGYIDNLPELPPLPKQED